MVVTDFLQDSNPVAMMQGIAERVKRSRLELNLTQKELSMRSGVSFGSLRKFETTGEISLKSLLKIAITLDATDEFMALFTRKQYQSIDELIQKTEKKRQRGSRK
jgi:transcriptional regulator with XRE-family HTH domain